MKYKGNEKRLDEVEIEVEIEDACAPQLLRRWEDEDEDEDEDKFGIWNLEFGIWNLSKHLNFYSGLTQLKNKYYI